MATEMQRDQGGALCSNGHDVCVVEGGARIEGVGLFFTTRTACVKH